MGYHVRLSRRYVHASHRNLGYRNDATSQLVFVTQSALVIQSFAMRDPGNPEIEDLSQQGNAYISYPITLLIR
jgi:hypothetical protein